MGNSPSKVGKVGAFSAPHDFPGPQKHLFGLVAPTPCTGTVLVLVNLVFDKQKKKYSKHISTSSCQMRCGVWRSGATWRCLPPKGKCRTTIPDERCTVEWTPERRSDDSGCKAIIVAGTCRKCPPRDRKHDTYAPSSRGRIAVFSHWTGCHALGDTGTVFFTLGNNTRQTTYVQSASEQRFSSVMCGPHRFDNFVTFYIERDVPEGYHCYEKTINDCTVRFPPWMEGELLYDGIRNVRSYRHKGFRCICTKRVEKT